MISNILWSVFIIYCLLHAFSFAHGIAKVNKTKRDRFIVYLEFLKGIFFVVLVVALVTTLLVFLECKSNICSISQYANDPIIMSFRDRLLSELIKWPLIGAMGLGLLAGIILAQRKSNKLLKEEVEIKMDPKTKKYMQKLFIGALEEIKEQEEDTYTEKNS